jgi:hypothetical protein
MAASGANPPGGPDGSWSHISTCSVSTAAEKCAKWRRENVPVGLREKGRKALEFGIAARVEARGA